MEETWQKVVRIREVVPAAGTHRVGLGVLTPAVAHHHRAATVAVHHRPPAALVQLGYTNTPDQQILSAGTPKFITLTVRTP